MSGFRVAGLYVCCQSLYEVRFHYCLGGRYGLEAHFNDTGLSLNISGTTLHKNSSIRLIAEYAWSEVSGHHLVLVS